MSLSRRVWILAAVFAFAFGLRLYRLDAVPLRGDEAFSVRFWAVPPSEFLRDPLDREPHPLGTFLGFWAWKNAAGDSAFAMRYLPLLGIWIGAAAAALARRFFGMIGRRFWRRSCGPSPISIWHAQDAQLRTVGRTQPAGDVAFLRAADLNRPRDWRLCVLAETLALYTFFRRLFLAAQGRLLMMRRTRFVWRRAVLAWAAIGVLLILVHTTVAAVWAITWAGSTTTLGDYIRGSCPPCCRKELLFPGVHSFTWPGSPCWD
jgi:hypothetical protein